MSTYTSYPSKPQLATHVTDILLRLGISASSFGYEYIRCAIILAYYDPEITEFPTKTLYPKVARLCHASSAGGVERSCRRAFERAISVNASMLTEIMGDISSVSHPSCASFILSVSRKLHEFADSENQ